MPIKKSPGPSSERDKTVSSSSSLSLSLSFKCALRESSCRIGLQANKNESRSLLAVDIQGHQDGCFCIVMSHDSYEQSHLGGGGGDFRTLKHAMFIILLSLTYLSYFFSKWRHPKVNMIGSIDG